MYFKYIPYKKVCLLKKVHKKNFKNLISFNSYYKSSEVEIFEIGNLFSVINYNSRNSNSTIILYK